MKLNSAKEAFTEQSSIFDTTYSDSFITQYKRYRIRKVIDQIKLPENSNILELNGGTGEDAIYFAKLGHTVHSTDLSEGMLSQMRSKITTHNLEHQIKSSQLDYHDLSSLQGEKYDLIYSNFGGLNCTENLSQVLNQMPSLLNKNGKICLVIMPPCSLWEWLSLLKGNFRLAFRRLKKNGTPSHIEGKHFLSWYYTPKFIKQQLETHCREVLTEGLCLIAPPVHYEHHFFNKVKTFKFLCKLEEKICNIYPFNAMADYFILVLEKKN